MVGGLSEDTAPADPIVLFQDWFAAAQRAGLSLPESVAVATASSDGAPSARMMLLKGVDHRGFVFFTNYGSRKAADLTENPRAALVFHWPTLQRQVRVDGDATQLSAEESAAYFRTRQRGSQTGAWASRQSQPLDNRSTLKRRVAEIERRFEGGDVPAPGFWGGYRVAPRRIEFWQGRINRLHDRLAYTMEQENWTRIRLYP